MLSRFCQLLFRFISIPVFHIKVSRPAVNFLHIHMINYRFANCKEKCRLCLSFFRKFVVPNSELRKVSPNKRENVETKKRINAQKLKEKEGIYNDRHFIQYLYDPRRQHRRQLTQKRTQRKAATCPVRRHGPRGHRHRHHRHRQQYAGQPVSCAVHRQPCCRQHHWYQSGDRRKIPAYRRCPRRQRSRTGTFDRNPAVLHRYPLYFRSHPERDLRR